MNQLRPFHLAIPVDDLEQARKFYGEKLQLEEGRSSDHWIDYNFFGHQLVVHIGEVQKVTINEVCLLYTSPSPRDKRQSRMPSSA